MRDLDQSDVDRDASDQRDAYIERLAESLEGADLTVIIDLFAAETGQTWRQFLDSALGSEILQSTQSSPSLAYSTLMEIDRVINS